MLAIKPETKATELRMESDSFGIHLPLKSLLRFV